jgi:class 3 adenylate cyclase
VLDEVAHGLDTERREPLGELRPYPGERRRRRVFVRSRPRSRRTLVHASEAGQRGARTHGEGQGKPTIGTRPDESYTRPVTESRKTVTIVFTDVTGSTALGEQTDPEAMRRIMERYFEEMRSVLERHGGTVEKFIGDAVMAVFGIPAVHEDDALRAVRAAAEMRERLVALNEEFERERGIRIAVRTGVNTGEVVAGDPAEGQAFATGDAVNVAARLEQAADPGEILLGPVTHELVKAAVRAEPVEALDLKGKAQAVEAWQLHEVLPDAPAFTRRIDAPFVGRAEELRHLRQAYDAAQATGACRLVTVTGAPGIGKSRLVRELVTSVGNEARIVVGRCLSYGEGITYWPLAEIMRQVGGADPRAGLVELLGDEPDEALAAERLLGAIGATDEPARTEEIFWATRILFERLARDRPLMAILDDVHWAEPTLLDLIEYLVGFTRGPVLVVCTARPELFDIRPDWSRTGLVELEPLDEHDASTLIDALLADTDLSPTVRAHIRERAEGNPLFVEQMLALASENGNGEILVPATIQALLAARLDHLPYDERAVLVRGAVEGRLFHRGAVSDLLSEAERDGVPGRLLALARKNFVRPDESLFPGDDAFRFVHVLVRDAAYEAAPKELRADLHERFAAWLDEKARERLSELEEILGYHLEQSYRYRLTLGEDAGGLARRAGEHLAAAGVRAARRSDHLATANLLERALALLPRDDERRFELVLPLGTSLVEGGKLEEAEALFSAAVADARERGLEAVAFAVEMEQERLRSSTDPAWSTAGALALIERALPALEAAGDDRGLAQAWRLVWWVEWARGRLAAARDASSKSLRHAEMADDPGLISDAYGGIGAPAWFGYDSISELLPLHERIHDWARRSGHRSTEGLMLSVKGRIKVEQRHLEEGDALIHEGLEMLSELGLTFTGLGVGAQFTYGDLIRDPGGVEARVRAAYDTLKAAGEKGIFSTMAGSLAWILARRGALEEAAALSRESEEAGSKEDIATQTLWRVARALVLAKEGRSDEAIALARDGVAVAAASEYAQFTAEARIALADVLRMADRPDEAVHELEEALRIYERKEFELSADAVRAELAELQSSGSPSQ